MGKSDRRARKKEKRDAGLVDGIRADVLDRYLETRYVCDGCGLDQPVRNNGDVSSQEIAPCDGLPTIPGLGLPELNCASETARMLHTFSAG